MAWGTGKAKDVDALMKELQSGETQLVSVGGKVYRCINVVKLVVRHPELPRHHLVNYAQQLHDGRKRPRNVLLSEKLQPGELAASGAIRAVKTNLGDVLPKVLAVDTILLKASTHVSWEEIMDSPSFPGLATRYNLQQFEIRLLGLPITEFATAEEEEGGRLKKNFWQWVKDCDDDLRYKSTTSNSLKNSLLPAATEDTPEGPKDVGRPFTAPPALVDKDPSLTVAFINSPIGSATYWPSPRRPNARGLRSAAAVPAVVEYRHGAHHQAGVLTPSARPSPARLRSPMWVPGTTAVHVCHLKPQPMQMVSGRSGCLSYLATAGTPTGSPRLPGEQPGSSPAPLSPRGLRVPLRHVPTPSSRVPNSEGNIAQAAESASTATALTVRNRRLYVRPTLDDPSTDNGDTAPQSRKARVRRLAANLHVSGPFGFSF